MFDPGDEANDSDEERERWGQILRVAMQVFHNNNEAGDATPNILNSSPRAVHSHVLTAGQTIIHGIM
jgi:hypothetical protein